MKIIIPRKLDKLGRVVVPYEIRQKMGWNTEDTLCFVADDDGRVYIETPEHSL